MGTLIVEKSLSFLAGKVYKKARVIARNIYVIRIFEKLCFAYKKTIAYFRLFGFKIVVYSGNKV